VRQLQVITLFLSKAALMGAAGSLAGITAGVAAGAWAAGIRPGDGTALELAGGWRLGWLFLLGLALSCGAVLGPAIMAARRDPAEVMGEE
jgi:ABC-type lipoprotein release transport system permease subunit